jgi:hypothetical protein
VTRSWPRCRSCNTSSTASGTTPFNQRHRKHHGRQDHQAGTLRGSPVTPSSGPAPDPQTMSNARSVTDNSGKRMAQLEGAFPPTAARQATAWNALLRQRFGVRVSGGAPSSPQVTPGTAATPRAGLLRRGPRWGRGWSCAGWCSGPGRPTTAAPARWSRSWPTSWGRASGGRGDDDQVDEDPEQLTSIDQRMSAGRECGGPSCRRSAPWCPCW